MKGIYIYIYKRDGGGVVIDKAKTRDVSVNNGMGLTYDMVAVCIDYLMKYTSLNDRKMNR